VTDAINSTVVTADQTGSQLTSFLYEPYGQTTSSGTYPFQFTGRVPAAGGLYYYRARYYDSGSGRFVSEDPAGFKGGVNLYAYVRNAPLMLTDPRGLGPWPCLDCSVYCVCYNGALCYCFGRDFANTCSCPAGRGLFTLIGGQCFYCDIPCRYFYGYGPIA